MDITKTLYVTDRKQLRSWFAENHDKEKEIWLIYYRKSSGKPRISYNHAVEEALCFGWIDSTAKRMDDERFAQRFTPRRPGSNISEMNKERMHRLIRQKRMTSAGLKAVSGVFDIPKHGDGKLIVAPDILKVLKADKKAWKNFQDFPEGYKKVRIGYIESQRRHSHEMFKKSLLNFIKMTSKNKRFGMVR
ncbi:MAG: YdeI/OmpD-associated family protein [Candidatus Woesearchaeota archaeon]|nr:YdeI/OmpD-associated family protein [Candidatus Woesearchaeota archaeon]